MQRNGVREGYVTVVTGPRGSLTLRGVPVMGRPKGKGVIERTVLISRDAPSWFHRLCFEKANTDFKIRIRITGTYGQYKAYASPLASSLEEALADPRNKKVLPVEDAFDHVAYECAVKAHEDVMRQNQLILVRHTIQGTTVRTIAVNSCGDKFSVSGGTIVSKLRNKIESGELSWERELKNYVRVRPVSVPQTT